MAKVEKRESNLLSLFFCVGFWPSAPHLQSALYDSNNKKILVPGFSSRAQRPRSRPRTQKKNGPGPDEKKPPQLTAVRVLVLLLLWHHQDFKREYPLTIFIVWVFKLPPKSTIFVVLRNKLTIDVIFKIIPFVI